MGRCFSLINLLMNLVYGLFQLFLPTSATSVPAYVGMYGGLALDYMLDGIVVLGEFVDLGYLMSLFIIVLEVDMTIMGYRFIMWCLKKIPVLGIK